MWSKECEESFKKVKAAMAHDLTLVHYNPSDKIILESDASNDAISVVLLTVRDCNRKLCQHFFKRKIFRFSYLSVNIVAGQFGYIRRDTEKNNSVSIRSFYNLSLCVLNIRTIVAAIASNRLTRLLFVLFIRSIWSSHRWILDCYHRGISTIIIWNPRIAGF